jgi:phosphomannomutase
MCCQPNNNDESYNASHLKSTGRLKNNIVVSTVMSNMGLGEALRKMGI